MRILEFVRVDALLKLKVEVGQQDGCRQLGDRFDERFPDADATAAQKGRETVRVSFLAARGQIVGTLWVEPLWDEFLGLEPFLWVVVQMVERDRKWITFTHLDWAALDIFAHAAGRAEKDGGLHAHRLVEAVDVEVEIVTVFKIDKGQDVQLWELVARLAPLLLLHGVQMRPDDPLLELLAKALLVLRVLDEGQDKVLGRGSACLRACKEEGQAFVNDTLVIVFEVRLSQQDGQKVSIGQLWVLCQLSLAFFDDLADELPQRAAVGQEVALIWQNVVAGGQLADQEALGVRYPINAASEALPKHIGEAALLKPALAPIVHLFVADILPERTL